ncbi:MAG TPA: hypothetical protein VGP07_03400 [Polyangia bacterium]|jgi:hypothetical protein
MPNAPTVELAENLGRAHAALQAGDLATADTQMLAAADLCRRLQAAGLGVPDGELTALRELSESCGNSLARLAERLNASAIRNENHRRGITSYHATLLREVG